MFLHKQTEKINLASLIISLILASVFLILSLAIWFSLESVSLILIAALLLFLITFVQLESYYRNQQLVLQQDKKLSELSQLKFSIDNQYRQIESLFSIFSLIKLRYPLPPMRGWAISPDFTKLVIASVQEQKPKLVVEMGSGVSTLVIGYCLQALGQGKVASLEHDEIYSGVSKNQVLNHSLQDVATVIYAPLKDMTIRNETWLWYDPRFLQDLEQKIDMLVIDGPPGDLQKLSRYPALPLLFEALSDDVVVLMDDSDRQDEQEIINRWKQEFSFLSVESVPTEKGACVLRLRK